MTDSILIVAPVREGIPGLPGMQEILADCGHRAWLTATGLALQLGVQVTTSCSDCTPPPSPMVMAQWALQLEVGTAMSDRLVGAARRHIEGAR